MTLTPEQEQVLRMLTPQRAQELVASLGRLAEIERRVDAINNHNPLALETLKFSASDGVKVDVIRDEDDMASDDVNALATQQSIKAYVDDNVQTEEEVEDIVGGMVTGNTETFIDVTYEDGDGTLDFVVPVKDEDDMASDSDTFLATQQSIKAYVDSAGGGNCYIETGEYSGDGATSQAVSLTDSSLVVKEVHIWLKVPDGGTISEWWTTDVMVDDDAQGLAVEHAPSAQTSQDNHIIALGTGSFTVDDAGGDAHPNRNGTNYYYRVLGTH